MRGSLLQRKCACGGSGSDGECDECKKGGTVQRPAAGAGGPASVPRVVHDVLRSPGHPLDADTRAFFEPRLGHDFSKVRVHTDERAAEAARAVNSLAFTVGNNLVFAQGQYRPALPTGRNLLAHEMVHVVQQNSLTENRQYALTLGPASDAYEREAERLSDTISAECSSPRRIPSAHQAGNAGVPVLRPQGLVTRAVVQRQIPTGVSLKEIKSFGHGDLKSDEDKKNIRTCIGAATLMQLLPDGNYNAGKGQGDCTKEHLSEMSNTCPTPAPFAFCEQSRCLEVDRAKNSGYPRAGALVSDGPASFVDLHVKTARTSMLENSGKNKCSVVCHQRYNYRTGADRREHNLGSFYIVQNFVAGTYTPPGATAPLHITTGATKKIAAPIDAPTKDKFAKDIAPGLVKSGVLGEAPPMPQRTP